MRKQSSIAKVVMVALLAGFNYTATLGQSSADKPPPSSRGGQPAKKENNKPALTLTKKDILSSDKITFLGIDLSNAVFVGGYEVWKSEAEIERLNPQWNQLMLSESDKYNIRRAMRNNNIDYKVGICIDHNKELDFSDKIVFSSSDEALSSDDITNTIQSYDFEDLTGLGMMFMIEYFDKNKAEGSMAVVFVNLNNKEIVYEERFKGVSAGFGLRNHWARSVLETIIQIDKKRYKYWQKNF